MSVLQICLQSLWNISWIVLWQIVGGFSQKVAAYFEGCGKKTAQTFRFYSGEKAKMQMIPTLNLTTERDICVHSMSFEFDFPQRGICFCHFWSTAFEFQNIAFHFQLYSWNMCSWFRGNFLWFRGNFLVLTPPKFVWPLNWRKTLKVCDIITTTTYPVYQLWSKVWVRGKPRDQFLLSDVRQTIVLTLKHHSTV